MSNYSNFWFDDVKTSVDDILLDGQEKPKPKKEDFIKLGIEESWINCVMEIYLNTENLLSNKATQVHQKLNGFRKKK